MRSSLAPCSRALPGVRLWPAHTYLITESYPCPLSAWAMALCQIGPSLSSFGAWMPPWETTAIEWVWITPVRAAASAAPAAVEGLATTST